ncbi:sigma factor-like helix-turn-helix DNA-binding protein [Mycoplasma sp. ATU-Cv-703]|uniref:sigma factor-like helix-turn-helix DNA-binding protein n=1 Tax=Mycoplasma sp. ATU-Cv-703 TaxID=2498595 RepID=UPI000FDE5C1B
MKKNPLNEREKWLVYYDRYEHFLTQAQKQTFHLYYLEDLTLQEVADVLATTRQAVSDTLKKARQKLSSVAAKLRG